MDIAHLLGQLGPLVPGSLIATDFDGTLAPLTVDPQQSRPVPGAVDALAALQARGAQIAVITGRDARTALRLGGLADVPGIVVAGLYGVETWHDGELETPQTPASIETLRARLPGTLREAGADPDVWIEDKRLSLVVHARRAADPDAALAKVAPAVGTLADELGLEMHPGSEVLELRVPGFDKGTTLERLVTRFAATGVLYLGDDLGDLPAFARLRDLRGTGTPAWSVGVLSSGVGAVRGAADLDVPDPAAAVALLTALASFRG